MPQNIQPCTWAQMDHPGSIFHGLNCWVRAVSGDTATVQFSHDGPDRQVALAALVVVARDDVQ